jgi:chromosome segregation ATPase
MSSKEILSLIEQFETAFDTFWQVLQKNNEEVLSHLKSAWRTMQAEQKEGETIKEKVSTQNSELTELRTKSEELDRTIEGLKVKKDELTTKISELTSSQETSINDLKGPQFELENLEGKLTAVNDKIIAKDSEKTTLDQKTVENENREIELTETYQKKMDDAEVKINQLRKENFFTSFLIEHSDEEIHEVSILAKIMENGSSKLDDLKKLLDVPPIMAVRTIKQMSVKGILNLDESTGTVTLP